jgi:hypothetical protein
MSIGAPPGGLDLAWPGPRMERARLSRGWIASASSLTEEPPPNQAAGSRAFRSAWALSCCPWGNAPDGAGIGSSSVGTSMLNRGSRTLVLPLLQIGSPSFFTGGSPNGRADQGGASLVS